jgi:hypothetical protein
LAAVVGAAPGFAVAAVFCGALLLPQAASAKVSAASSARLAVRADETNRADWINAVMV